MQSTGTFFRAIALSFKISSLSWYSIGESLSKGKNQINNSYCNLNTENRCTSSITFTRSQYNYVTMMYQSQQLHYLVCKMYFLTILAKKLHLPIVQGFQTGLLAPGYLTGLSLLTEMFQVHCHLLTLVMMASQTGHYLSWLSLKVFFLSHLAMQSTVIVTIVTKILNLKPEGFMFYLLIG